ncbi:gamma-glutamyltransferase [Plesiocystis pacifica SIR-1]|uniref:Glutathione hydrolase proenzyme n=1 Tax=Plesiocystis pacifica SIR-1 TaxID=391625 RepID=A6FXD0_9BACT|nr:gamma-glutamyltransferase [Plesiocystis pacifica SIR-1]
MVEMTVARWWCLLGLLSLSMGACDRGRAEPEAPARSEAATTEAVEPAQAEPPPRLAETLGGGDRLVGANYARSPVHAVHGMAATAHPLATKAAVDILEAGGSAVDAAIAANAVLGVVEPTGNGIGGDLFAIVWDPKTKAVVGYNGSGRSPKGRSLEQLRAKLGERDSIPAYGSLPVTVPGTVDGWFALHERYGRLDMAQVLAPAIEAAREGFAMAPVIAMYWGANMARFEAHLAEHPGSIEELDNARATYLVDGEAPVAGQVFRNPDLAQTLEGIAAGGREVFYSGATAATIDAYMKRIGGDLRAEDLAAHRGEWVSPGHVNYRGCEVYELPPNGQGYAALQMLQILEQVELGALDRGGAELLHYLIEAKRLAFEDMARYYADPEFSPAPLEALLSDAYARERFALIDPQRASTSFDAGEPKLEGPGDTTYLSVADEAGMMVSLIQSNYRGMGSGLVPDGLGFMLQDRGQLFALEPGHANVYAPGKRPFHTIIPAFVTKDGEPWLSFGVMGGAMQPQGHVQVLINLIDFGMNLQEAGDAARVRHEGGRQPTGAEGELLGRVHVESGIPAATVEGLRARGHVVVVKPGGFGGYQAVMRDAERGTYVGATEMRKDGLALGY